MNQLVVATALLCGSQVLAQDPNPSSAIQFEEGSGVPAPVDPSTGTRAVPQTVSEREGNNGPPWGLYCL